MIKPVNIRTFLASNLSQNKHFVFPGFFQPDLAWEHPLLVSFHAKNRLSLLFMKSAFFD